MQNNKKNFWIIETKKTKTKLSYFSLIFILVFIIFLIQQKIFNKKEPLSQVIIKTNTIEILVKFNNNYPRALAYLSLNQFLVGLTQDKIDDYQIILNSLNDYDELNVDKILKGFLNTASTPLIQGAIDFLGSNLKQKIKLIINNNPNMSVETISPVDKDKKELLFKLKNDREHFFINDFEDTVGDGYCFFNAIIYLLDQTKPNWKEIVFSKQQQKIFTDEEIKEILFKFKSK
ncbi:hypothetical protein [Candidatus Phytoplasma fraxini]|uniref:OTU domain-containing protein n=1 Tax=Ash yellows phytoplasma TaxID=35780 RepID=A0ABZ2UDP2_ASHYP